jgi:hypothetical protein
MFGPYIPPHTNPKLPYGKGPFMQPQHGTGPVIPPHGRPMQPIHMKPPHGTGPVMPPHGRPLKPIHVDSSCHFPAPAPVRVYCQPAAFHRVDGEPYQNMSVAYGSSRPLNRYA